MQLLGLLRARSVCFSYIRLPWVPSLAQRWIWNTSSGNVVSYVFRRNFPLILKDGGLAFVRVDKWLWIARAWRFSWKQVPDVARSSSGSGCQLCRQHWSQKLVCHFCEGRERSIEQTSSRRCGRHGHGHCEERQTWLKKESDACCHRPPAQALETQRRCLHVLRRYAKCSLFHTENLAD